MVCCENPKSPLKQIRIGWPYDSQTSYLQAFQPLCQYESGFWSFRNLSNDVSPLRPGRIHLWLLSHSGRAESNKTFATNSEAPVLRCLGGAGGFLSNIAHLGCGVKVDFHITLILLKQRFDSIVKKVGQSWGKDFCGSFSFQPSRCCTLRCILPGQRPATNG